MKTTVIFFKTKLFAELRKNIQELRDTLFYYVSENYLENHRLYKYNSDLGKVFDSIPNDFYFDDILTIVSDETLTFELSSLQETIEFFDKYKNVIILHESDKIIERKLNSFWKENPNGLIRIC